MAVNPETLKKKAEIEKYAKEHRVGMTVACERLGYRKGYYSGLKYQLQHGRRGAAHTSQQEFPIDYRQTLDEGLTQKTEQVKLILSSNPEMTVTKACETVGLTRARFYTAIKKRGISPGDMVGDRVRGVRTSKKTKKQPRFQEPKLITVSVPDEEDSREETGYAVPPAPATPLTVYVCRGGAHEIRQFIQALDEVSNG